MLSHAAGRPLPRGERQGLCGPGTTARNTTVAGVSGTSGRSLARSVRKVCASTKASNRSSLLPADP